MIIANSKLSLGISDYSKIWNGNVVCFELIQRSLAMVLLKKPDSTESLIIYSYLDKEIKFTYDFIGRCEGVAPGYVQMLGLISFCDTNSLILIDVSNQE